MHRDCSDKLCSKDDPWSIKMPKKRTLGVILQQQLSVFYSLHYAICSLKTSLLKSLFDIWFLLKYTFLFIYTEITNWIFSFHLN